MITSPSNNIYIGQTTNFNRRMNSYKNYEKIKNQKALKNSLTKYGFENHRISILKECNKNEMDFWECFYIKIFNSFENGLNSTSGGKTPIKKRGYKISEEWKSKISKSHIGKKRESFSEEWRKNISLAHKGMKRTDKWIENLKKAAKIRKENNGYVISEEQKNKFKKSIKDYFNSEAGIIQRKKIANKAKETFSIPVYQIENGNVVAEYSSAREASKILGIAHSHIINCCNKKCKTAGGYVWEKKNAEKK